MVCWLLLGQLFFFNLFLHKSGWYFAMHTQDCRQCNWQKLLAVGVGLVALVLLPLSLGCDISQFFDGDVNGTKTGSDLQVKMGNRLDESAIEDAIQKISVLTQEAVQSAPPDYEKLLEAGVIAESLRAHLDELHPMAKPLIAQAYYNQACAYSVKSDLDKAFAALEESITLGFEDQKLMREDSDLDNLRKDKRFEEVMKTFEELAAKAREKQIEEYFAATQPYPFDFKLESVEGKMVSLSEMRGAKVTIVDFWGTWCPPCRMEIPHFVELHQEYGDKGVQIIGINYERTEKEEGLAQIKDFAEGADIKYPLVLGDEATQNQVPGFRGFPTTLFLDSQGIVRAQTVGYVSKEILAGIVERILEKSK
jgi:thiol-disulfide isomerase/thioredoxin